MSKNPKRVPTNKKFRKELKQPIFIIGYGRSGTHWLARTLATHTEIRATIEVQPIFSMVKEMALNFHLEKKYFWQLILRYRWQILISKPKRYLDKSHPNLWLAEKLAKAFPTAVFLGIERNPYATVASAMVHKGGYAIRRRWRDFPIPNQFLGIDCQTAKTYENMPAEEKYSLSWLSHHKRMDALKEAFGDSLMVITYEDFALQTNEVLDRLETFLGLDSPIEKPEVKLDSLWKWETQLSDMQINNIYAIVNIPPDKGAYKAILAKDRN